MLKMIRTAEIVLLLFPIYLIHVAGSDNISFLVIGLPIFAVLAYLVAAILARYDIGTKAEYLLEFVGIILSIIIVLMHVFIIFPKVGESVLVVPEYFDDWYTTVSYIEAFQTVEKPYLIISSAISVIYFLLGFSRIKHTKNKLDIGFCILQILYSLYFGSIGSLLIIRAITGAIASGEG